jgi:hypothetical protein
VNSRLKDIVATADYLSVSEATIRRLVGSGEISPVRLPSSRHGGEGRRLLFDLDDLDAAIERWKRESSHEPNAGLSAAAIKGWKQSPTRTRRSVAETAR